MDPSAEDSPIEIQTGPQADAAVIWLHGLGADGNDFVPIVEQLPLAATAHIRFIFPHAPLRPVTCNGGYTMRAWYDIYSLEDFAREDEAGLLEAQQIVSRLIERENQRGIPSQRIILMGFSQGGAVALYSGLRHSEPLAGIGALSTYLPLRRTAESEYNPQKRQIFMAHGLYDPVVKYEYGKTSYELLKQMGHEVTWMKYPMEHSVCIEEINDIGAWINARLPL